MWLDEIRNLILVKLINKNMSIGKNYFTSLPSGGVKRNMWLNVYITYEFLEYVCWVDNFEIW